MQELCLGTVQLGMKYGVNNVLGRQPYKDESFSILEYAVEHGITTFDTAGAYGEAELILGEFLRTKKRYKKDIRIISKLLPNVVKEQEKDVIGTLKSIVEESLNRIGTSVLDGYLLHTPEYIYNQQIVKALCTLKEEKYVKNIGISIYELQDGYAALETGMMDYIQMPFSILDQRGIKEGFISKAKKAGITIFTRSAFLQGLLMMSRNQLPKYLQYAYPYLRDIDMILKKYNVDKVSAILGFVKYERDIDYLVFGVETKEQLEEDIMKANQMWVPEECIQELKKIGSVDKAVIFPSLWSNREELK